MLFKDRRVSRSLIGYWSTASVVKNLISKNHSYTLLKPLFNINAFPASLVFGIN